MDLVQIITDQLKLFVRQFCWKFALLLRFSCIQNEISLQIVTLAPTVGQIFLNHQFFCNNLLVDRLFHGKITRKTSLHSSWSSWLFQRCVSPTYLTLTVRGWSLFGCSHIIIRLVYKLPRGHFFLNSQTYRKRVNTGVSEITFNTTFRPWDVHQRKPPVTQPFWNIRSLMLSHKLQIPGNVSGTIKVKIKSEQRTWGD